MAEVTNDNGCSCSFKDHHILSYKILEVSMASAAVRDGWNFGRKVAEVITLGVSNTFNGGLKDLTHDTVQLSCWCPLHSKYNNFVINFGKKNNPGLQPGKYKDYIKVTSSGELNAGSSGRETLASKLMDYQSELQKKAYSLTDYNCSHFSDDIFEFCKKNSG